MQTSVATLVGDGAQLLAHPEAAALTAPRTEPSRDAVRDEGPFSPITVKVASTREEREAAFRLIYRRYLEAGLSEPTAHGMRVTPCHLLPTTTVFVAIYKDEVIFTMSLIGDGSAGLPMESIFPEEIQGLRAQSLRLAEVSCLADRRRHLLRFLPLFVRVARLLLQFSRHHGIERLLIAVHPKHGRFYQRFYGFRQLGHERPYSSVQNAPAVAYALDYSWMSPERHELSFGESIPCEELQPWPMSSAECTYFEPVARPLGAAELLSGGYDL